MLRVENNEPIAYSSVCASLEQGREIFLLTVIKLYDTVPTFKV